MCVMQRQNRPYTGDMVWKVPEVLLLSQYVEIIKLLQGVFLLQKDHDYELLLSPLLQAGILLSCLGLEHLMGTSCNHDVIEWSHTSQSQRGQRKREIDPMAPGAT